MSAKKENATIVGIGVAACAACCAGPILGVLAAIGLGTAAGFVLIGTVALVLGVAAVAAVVVRRQITQVGDADEDGALGPNPGSSAVERDCHARCHELRPVAAHSTVPC